MALNEENMIINKIYTNLYNYMVIYGRPLVLLYCFIVPDSLFLALIGWALQ